MVGRSFKYHRPRGIVASGAEEPNALVGLGDGRHARTEPARDHDGAGRRHAGRTQNHWPSLEWDIGEVNGWLSRFLPRGSTTRPSCGRAPSGSTLRAGIRSPPGWGGPDPTGRMPIATSISTPMCSSCRGRHRRAGRRAEAGRAGAKVADANRRPIGAGARPVDGVTVDGARRGLGRRRRGGTAGDGERPCGCAPWSRGLRPWLRLAYERCRTTPAGCRPRHRLWRIRARQVISATGAIERPLSFAGNDKPGVMLASAVRDYGADYGVSPGTGRWS
jgi:sarcosine oxidase subunit alpha